MYEVIFIQFKNNTESSKSLGTKRISVEKINNTKMGNLVHKVPLLLEIM